MTHNPFDIVIVPFPFVDELDKEKYRPAVIISNHEYCQKTGCSILLMITSAKNSKFWNDYQIQNYDNTNLRGDCIIRMKAITLDNFLLKTKIGQLNQEDIVNLKSNFQKCLF